ncbi:MAG: regulatory protein RecX, partial [Thermoanaerobaculia bacterium]
CYTAAMRILQFRFNSSAELTRKLERKGFERGVVDTTIERLREEKWIDDDRFAGAWVRSRALKRLGPHRIRQELRAAGVDDADASHAIAANLPAEQQRAQVEALCTKKFRALVRRNGDEYAATDECRNKLTAYLLKQGYDAGLVYDVIKEMRVVDHKRDS